MSNWMEMLNSMDESDVAGGDIQPLPDGWYEVVTSDATEKANKNTPGHHIGVTFTVVGDDYNGRLVWGTYNVDNPSATAQKIGLGELKRMMLAAGLDKMADVDDLNDLTLWIKVGRDKKNADRNVVKAYRKDAPGKEEPSAEPAAKPAPDPVAAPAAKPATRKPWLKK
jgi:Protein of unknown function (DUF669).